MLSERHRLESEAGFTLIEVVVAMVILAVGLLALEALGIGAARSLALAENKNELVAVATSSMERAQQTVRTQLLQSPPVVSTGNSCGTDSATGFYICTNIQTRASLGTLSTGNSRISVTVSRSQGSTEQFTVTSHVFDPELP